MMTMQMRILIKRNTYDDNAGDDFDKEDTYDDNADDDFYNEDTYDDNADVDLIKKGYI